MIIVTAAPTNEATPTRTSDEPRGTKRDLRVKCGADRVSSSSVTDCGGRNLISGHGSEIILSAMPTNEVTPTIISDGPRETKRDPRAALDAKIAPCPMGHHS